MKNFFTFLTGALIFAGIYWFAFYKTPEVRSFEKTLAVAKQGDAAAMLQTGIAYETGIGTTQDGAKAEEYYRQAASAGNIEATYRLGKLYEEGTLVSADPEEAFVYYQVAAAQGFAPAQEALARFYQEGKGGAATHEGEALLWWIRAAKQDSKNALQKVKEAQMNDLLRYEQVLSFDDLLQKPLQDMDAATCFAIGTSYRIGNPIVRNDEEAFKWFKEAWDKGEGFSQAAVEMAEMYRLGEGVEKNEQKALTLYAQAAELKNPQAQYFLGKRSYEDNPPNYKDAFAWFSNAAEQGYAPAQYMTGYMLLQGQGTPRSQKLAVDFFTRSAQQEYSAAQYVLGQIYWKGLGVKKNQALGRSWLEKAAQNGNTSAQTFLESI